MPPHSSCRLSLAVVVPPQLLLYMAVAPEEKIKYVAFRTPLNAHMKRLRGEGSGLNLLLASTLSQCNWLVLYTTGGATKLSNSHAAWSKNERAARQRERSSKATAFCSRTLQIDGAAHWSTRRSSCSYGEEGHDNCTQPCPLSSPRSRQTPPAADSNSSKQLSPKCAACRNVRAPWNAAA